MLYNLLNKLSANVLGGEVNFLRFAVFAVSLIIGFVCLKFFKKILPKDQGRAFAVNGALSEGKARGAGLIFITSFVFCTALFVPLTREFLIYLVLVYAAMLSGYFDDASEKPWGNIKKGLIDLVISVGTAVTYYIYNGSTINIALFKMYNVHLNPVLFIILGAVLVWAAINVTNCTDGVDGLCSSLCIVSIVFFMTLSGMSGDSSTIRSICSIMLATLIAYLWFNCSPSQILMGDAGSRALGVFLAILSMKTTDPIMFVPLCLVIIIDGGLGLLKLSFRRFLKMKKFMEGIRTPIHDHIRKNKGWSDTQVVTRFVLVQIVIDVFYYLLLV